jgi:hypothetical protein
MDWEALARKAGNKLWIEYARGTVEPRDEYDQLIRAIGKDPTDRFKSERLKRRAYLATH